MPSTSARRVRLDQLLVERGLAPTRSRAQALVLAGKVKVGSGDAARHDLKAGDMVAPDAPVDVAAGREWVSRGAHKLIAALDAFEIDPVGLVAVDVGASTGGFTDVLLARGATKVYAVDVGYGQLADRLRADPRVVSMERVNARTLTAASLPEPADLAVIDVAFISLGLVLGPVTAVLRPDGTIVALVKPQFEAGRADVPGGVVRDRAVHLRVLRDVAAKAADARARDASRHRVADPGAGGEPRVPRLVRQRAVVRGPGAADRGRGRCSLGGRAVTVKRIGFAYNPTIEDAVDLSERAAGWCRLRGIGHWAAPAGETAQLVGELGTTDVLVVLGGDGTFLRAVMAVAEVDVPILGINLGKVGFLSKAEADGLEPVLGQLVEGAWDVAERMALTGSILPGGRPDRAHVHRAQRHRHRPRLARPRRAARRRHRREPPRDVHRGRSRRLQPHGLDRVLLLGRRPDPRSAQPQPRRHAHRRRTCPRSARSWCRRHRSFGAGSSTRTRPSSPSTGARTTASTSATSSRCRALERPIRFVEPHGTQPFWDLLRTKVQLLPS